MLQGGCRIISGALVQRGEQVADLVVDLGRVRRPWPQSPSRSRFPISAAEPMDGHPHSPLGRARAARAGRGIADGPGGRRSRRGTAPRTSQTDRPSVFLAELLQDPPSRINAQFRSKIHSGVEVVGRLPGIAAFGLVGVDPHDGAAAAALRAVHGRGGWRGSRRRGCRKARKRPRAGSAAARTPFSSRRTKRSWVRSNAWSGSWPRRRM